MQAYEVKAEELVAFSNELDKMAGIAFGVEGVAEYCKLESVEATAAELKDKLSATACSYRRLRRYAKDNQEAILAVDIEKVKQESEAALKEVVDLFKSRYGL